MTQLIDKDKIVAEIEELIDKPAPSHDQQCPWEDGYYCGLYKAESIIDNLEVKEVDLEKEIMKYQREIYDRDTTVRDVAKHFFELGLKAQKGE